MRLSHHIWGICCLSLTSLALCGQDVLQAPNSGANHCAAADNGKAPSIAWTVLPEKVVRDNYGHNVSNNYIAIDVTVYNNNCSDQLLVKTFTFKNLSHNDDPDLTTDPDLIKGSIVKGQEVGRRNRSVAAIKSMGLLATGSAGFFKAAGASATFNRGVTIFSDPFEKGIEMVFPDTTVKYLANWNTNTVFKNGFAVEPQSETRGQVFLPIDFVCQQLKADPKDCRSGHHFSGATYNPAAIKASLGRMSAFGHEIAIQPKGPIATGAV